MLWFMWILLFLSIGAPIWALLLDRLFGFQATRFFKTIGLAALGVFAVSTAYAYIVADPIFYLLVWGIVGGLLGTVALDIIRLIGFKFGQFPADMPKIFGLMALGVASKLPKNIMVNMVAMLADLPENKRKEMMVERIEAVAGLPESVRRTFVTGMMAGINKLPEGKKEKILKTQMEILSELSSEKRRAMMQTMDEIMAGKPATFDHNEVKELMSAFRAGKIPRLPMEMFRDFAKKAIPQTVDESGISMTKVLTAGYLWHAINGATFGVMYTLVVGSGSWLLAFGWCTFIWLVMMAVMPPMMPMIKFPWPRFAIVPLLAHLAMAIPLGYIALTYISPEISASSLLGFIGI